MLTRPKNLKNRGRTVTRQRARTIIMEALEPRQLFSLVGVSLTTTPVIAFDNSDPAALTYSAATHDFALSGELTLSFPPGVISPPGSAVMDIKVDNSGALTGASSSTDLVVTDQSGTLLTGQISQFGYLFQDSTDAAFDFVFHVTGGSLQSSFSGQDIGVQLFADKSNFTGSFANDFQTDLKAFVGPIPGGGTPPLVIAGHKFLDNTDNGLTADDTPLAGVTIQVFADTNNSGVLDSGDTLAGSQVTDSTGSYLFTGLPAGIYFVTEQNQPGYVQTGPASGSYTVNGTNGGAFTGLDFDNFQIRSPKLVTNASLVASNLVGSTTQDSATLSGGFNETGLITFTLTAPDGTTSTVGSVGVNSDGTFNSPTVVTTEVGTYTWHASYSGDALNNGAIDNGVNESVTTIKASPSIATSASQTPGNVVGSILHDSATISGGFNVGAGSILFTLTAPDGSTSTVGSVIVNSAGTFNSPTVVSTEVGTYTWHASYTGDALNNGAIDNGVNESVTTIKSSPSIITVASETAGGVVGSAILSDKVTVTGGVSPTGKIVFTLTAPDGTTASVGNITISGDGTFNSPTVTATEVGTYTWHASYVGDALNNGAIDNGVNESVTTVKTSPSIVTVASETAGGVVGSAILSDKVTVSGAYAVTGLITFKLTAPDGTISTVGTVPVTGNGTFNSPTVTATQVGVYTWHASYAGDSLNNGAIDNGVNESVTTIKASPTIVTTASLTTASCNWLGAAIPQDSAVISGGYKETGTIVFTLKAPDGTTVDNESITVNKDGIYTTSNTHVATQVGIYTWSATYAGDGLNNSAKDQGGSAEQITITTGGTISGHKFLDITGNGLSGDDTGLGNVTIQLYTDVSGNGVIDSNDKLIATQVTAAGTGAYSFTGLAAGHYIVKEVNPAGFVQTGPTSGTYAVTLANNGTSTGNDFDDFQTDNCIVNCISYLINGCKTVSDISGQLHQGDVVKVTFTLPAPETISFVSYTAPDAYFNASDASQQKIYDVDTKTFTSPGTYSLTVVVPNCDYQVDLVCGYAIDQLGPAGSNIFYSAQNRLHDSDNGGTTSCIPPVATCNGNNTITGCVYNDCNNDGKKGTTEGGVSGIKVTCYGTTSSGASLIVTCTTDANGNYKFGNLPNGTYKVVENDVLGDFDGKSSTGTCGGTACTDLFTNVCLTGGKTASGYNFAELPCASICGTVYADKDKDGKIDSNECGIAGVKITLTGTDDCGNAVCVTTYTDSNGCYSFDNLRSGKYTLCETEPTGYTTTHNSVGCDGGTLSGDSICSICLNWNDDGTGYNFGDVSH